MIDVRTMFLGSVFSLLLLGGCAAFDRQTQGVETWLAKPATTQPGSPSNEQAVTSVTQVYTPLGLATSVALLMLHMYNSSRRGEKTLAKLDEVHDEVKAPKE